MSRWHSRWLRTKNDSKKETGLQDRQVLVPNFMQILLQTIEPNKLLNRIWVRHSSRVRCFWVMKRLIAVKRWTIKCYGTIEENLPLWSGGVTSGRAMVFCLSRPGLNFWMDLGFLRFRTADNLFSLGIGLFLIRCHRTVHPLAAYGLDDCVARPFSRTEMASGPEDAA